MEAAKGAARSLTDVFKAARLDYKRNPSLQSSLSDASGKQVFLEGSPRSDDPVAAVILPPAWVDTFDTAYELVPQMREKIDILYRKQQERLQLAFGDVEAKDREIMSVTGQLTNVSGR